MDLQKIKEAVQGQHAQQVEVKNGIAAHISTIETTVKEGGGGGGGSWTYIALFQVLFVVALVLYRRSGGVDQKQHLV